MTRRCVPDPHPHAETGAAGTVMAFDFGTRRIGVAVGETELALAHPVATIAFEDNRRRLEAVERLVAEWHPVQLVVGCPGMQSEREHPLAPAVARFARRLRARTGLPVAVIDEALSSWEGSRRLGESGVRAREQKADLDAMAACVILETWFDAAQARSHRPPQEP